MTTTTKTLTVGDNGRLPIVVIPNHYDLSYRRVSLEPPYHFEGQVVIDVVAPSVTVSEKDASLLASSLVLHARDLQLLHATLSTTTMPTNDHHQESTTTKPTTKKTCWNATEFRYQFHHHTCQIMFDHDASSTSSSIWTPNTHYKLTIDFVGFLNDQMAGFYRSSYTDLAGHKVVMATTQFEPTDARRAFPCFDEPALKATFQLRVTVPAHLSVVSNTPMVSSHTTSSASTTTNNNNKTVTFATTPKMSTYLVACVIGLFDHIAMTSTTTQIQTTVYTVPGKASQGQFCLDTASRCLDFLQEIYGVPYPLRKSDLLAIPDFAAGAMENWGCVTYREAKVCCRIIVWFYDPMMHEALGCVFSKVVDIGFFGWVEVDG